MAYEIWEKNFDCERIILAGIANAGTKLGEMLKQKLELINCTKQLELIEVKVDKHSPNVDNIEFSKTIAPLADDVVIIVDDVLYTGGTMVHATIPYIQMGFTKVQVAVLVFRDYLKFPIRPDFVGISLASTTQEHVEVILDANNSSAYLS